ncbi:hypothetical protein PHLGIDRAFT_307762 [Phlebiopsis gigantea 11061_1 CR5-6]|uniref:Uncharacterized protein n=1 Tax=Phlebiopsis gigantea (strain 11061_1 CR5-6) TaxID=745531 RepID=A0A0C3SB21_PHLG1|nr:hypothetical protein PHLGIDRAFT_307762 [Phlebiopsis gigantea 11061_1 CR5-6]
MSFQLPRALLFKAARPAVRVAGRNAGRRTMSNAAHASQPKSDKPWIIGSTIVFGSAAVYLVSPPGKQKAHKAKEAALPRESSPDPDSAPVPTGNESETSPPESQPEVCYRL